VATAAAALSRTCAGRRLVGAPAPAAAREREPEAAGAPSRAALGPRLWEVAAACVAEVAPAAAVRCATCGEVILAAPVPAARRRRLRPARGVPRADRGLTGTTGALRAK